MEYIKEYFRFKDPFSFIMFETNSRQTLIHCHDCLEINYIEKGTGHYVIEDKTYPIQEGDIFIINNSEKHIAVHNGELTMLVIVFDPKFVWENPEEYNHLKPFFHRGTSFSNRIRREDENYTRLCTCFSQIHEEYSLKNDGWQLIIRATLMLFLALTYRYYLHNHELGEDVQAFRKSYERIRTLVEYINAHFSDPLTLEGLAEKALMNKTYLSTYFKDVMKINVFEYIEQVRINHACMLLKTTSLPITDISLDSGFNSVSYFNRIFKRIVGAAPSTYRKKSKYSSSSLK